MPSSAIPGFDDFRKLLQSCAPGQKGFGDLCEQLKKVPIWFIGWSLNLETDRQAIPFGLSKADAKAFRRWAKKNPDKIAAIRPLGAQMIEFFGSCPLIGVQPDELNKVTKTDRVLLAIVQFREMGRNGLFVLIALGIFLKALTMPVQSSPDDEEVPARFYAIRCLAISCILMMLSKCDQIMADGAVSVRDEASRSAIFSGAKLLCEYAKMAREALNSTNDLRNPELGPTSFLGITAQSATEIAIRFSEQLVGKMLAAVDPTNGTWAF